MAGCRDPTAIAYRPLKVCWRYLTILNLKKDPFIR
jgi:hypothetical protein